LITSPISSRARRSSSVRANTAGSIAHCEGPQRMLGSGAQPEGHRCGHHCHRDPRAQPNNG
jgi:hypothetical protein